MGPPLLKIGIKLTKSITHPVILLIPIVVFRGAEGMSDALYTVHYGAGEIVDGKDSERDQRLDEQV